MELQLKHSQISCYESVLRTAAAHEETMEMIVPDAFPDLLRIVDTDGLVCLRTKEVKTGAAQIEGVVKASILYVPDGAAGLVRLPLQIPFSHKIEHTGIVPQMALSVEPALTFAEARMVNSRKVTATVQLSLAVAGNVPAVMDFCTAVEAEEALSLQTRETEQTLWVITGAGDKPFQFSEQMALPSGKPEVEEVLKCRIAATCDDAKLIGGKLIFKGEVGVQIVYRSTGGAVQTADYHLPYSQMMELKGVGEDAGCAVSVALTDCSVGVEQDGSGSAFLFSMGFLAQAQAWEEKKITLLSDLYSTACTAVLQVQTYAVNSLREVGENRKSCRESVETEVLPKAVLDAYVLTGPANRMQGETETVFSAETRAMVLYVGEDNQVYQARLRIPVEERIALDAGKTCVCRAACPGEVFATPTAEGLEVRYSVDFCYEALTEQKLTGVSDLTLEEAEPGVRPSMVVRMTETGDQLWDLAKRYGSTVEDIQAANVLEEGELSPGRLLLIPRRR